MMIIGDSNDIFVMMVVMMNTDDYLNNLSTPPNITPSIVATDDS